VREITTGDETWCFNMISKAKDKICNGNSGHTNDPKSWHIEITNEDNCHHFFRYQGYCSLEFIPQGQRVNKTYYAEIMKRLREAVRIKRPESLEND
jgi:hypothetical protein